MKIGHHQALYAGFVGSFIIIIHSLQLYYAVVETIHVHSRQILIIFKMTVFHNNFVWTKITCWTSAV